jgi:hypothetical protein
MRHSIGISRFDQHDSTNLAYFFRFKVIGFVSRQSVSTRGHHSSRSVTMWVPTKSPQCKSKLSVLPVQVLIFVNKRDLRAILVQQQDFCRSASARELPEPTEHSQNQESQEPSAETKQDTV